jgi:hypothetical protein
MHKKQTAIILRVDFWKFSSFEASGWGGLYDPHKAQ